ncbi:hypothetical protein GCM10010486_43380 [Nonomuraea roseoviolacea subsp. carminata]
MSSVRGVPAFAAAVLSLTLLAPSGLTAPTPTPIPTPTPTASTGRATALPLPGVGVTYQQASRDPARLSTYGLGTKATYVRARTGDAFTVRAGVSEAAVSPDGRTLAAVPTTYRASKDALLLGDRTTGALRRVPTVAKPLAASSVAWSRDGRRVVLTVERKTGGSWRAAGFTVVDAAAGTARTVMVAGLDTRAAFTWTPAGELIARYGDGLRAYRAADGAVLSTHTALGRPAGPEDPYSPSGRRLALWCPPRSAERLCVADPATGRITRRVAVRPAALFGWWDEDHVIAVMPQNGAYRLTVVGLDGRVTRALAVIPARTWTAELWLTFNRASQPSPA